MASHSKRSHAANDTAYMHGESGKDRSTTVGQGFFQGALIQNIRFQITHGAAPAYVALDETQSSKSHPAANACRAYRLHPKLSCSIVNGRYNPFNGE